MKYLFRFYGRRIGAIGDTYYNEAEREGDTKEAAFLGLYDEFEHIIPKEIADKTVLDCLFLRKRRVI